MEQWVNHSNIGQTLRAATPLMLTGLGFCSGLWLVSCQYRLRLVKPSDSSPFKVGADFG